MCWCGRGICEWYRDLILANHGPIAFEEISLAGCPVVGVRTGSPLVLPGETGILGERLPPGSECLVCEDDKNPLTFFIDGIDQAKSPIRREVRELASKQSKTSTIVDLILKTQRKLKGRPDEGVSYPGNHCGSTEDVRVPAIAILPLTSFGEFKSS